MSAQDDVDKVAGLVVDAILGGLSIGIKDGLALKGLYQRYAGDASLRAQTLERIAEMMCERAPGLAARLADAIAERVGK